jgi:hypothetical protein
MRLNSRQTRGHEQTSGALTSFLCVQYRVGGTRRSNCLPTRKDQRRQREKRVSDTRGRGGVVMMIRVVVGRGLALLRGKKEGRKECV